MYRSTFTRLAVTTLLVSSLSGCNIYKKFDIASQPGDLAAEYAAALSETPDSSSFGNLPWQEIFTDPMLGDLIARALEVNTNLDNARLNVEIARANLAGARMAYLPSLALAPNGGASSVSNGTLTGWHYSIPATASWEVDLFGKLLNSKRSAEAGVAQAEAYRQAVRSQVIAGVANCYYTIATLQAQLQLNRETAELWKRNVEVMRDYKEAGRTNEAAVMQADANYRSVLASIADLETSLHHAGNAMSLLLHERPHSWSVNARPLYLPAGFDGGIPMSTLAARPDVRAAEMTLARAYYATNQARAAFYPGLTITANYGFTNQLGAMIKNPGDWFASLAGSLAAPLFTRGQNMARLRAAKASQQQALNDFENTILAASAEVSNALTSYNNIIEQSRHIDVRVDDLMKATDYTGELFKVASATYLEVLTAQTSLLSARMSQLSCDLSRAQAVITLYSALGGGR